MFSVTETLQTIGNEGRKSRGILDSIGDAPSPQLPVKFCVQDITDKNRLSPDGEEDDCNQSVWVSQGHSGGRGLLFFFLFFLGGGGVGGVTPAKAAENGNG